MNKIIVHCYLLSADLPIMILMGQIVDFLMRLKKIKIVYSIGLIDIEICNIHIIHIIFLKD